MNVEKSRSINDIPKNLSELKQEKEDLKEYYEILSKRREEILALRKIKDLNKRKAAIELKKANQESVSLLFQDGVFKHNVGYPVNKTHENNPLPSNQSAPIRRDLERREYNRPNPVVASPVQPLDDFTKKPPEELSFKIDGNRQFNKTNAQMTRSLPMMVEPSLDLKEGKIPSKPITPERNITPTEPIKQPITKPINTQPIARTQPTPIAPPLTQPLPPPVAQQPSATVPITTKQVQNANETLAIQPEAAIVLEPFDKLKTEREINEESNALMPKNSKLFTISIIILTVLLVLMFAVILIWGFASNWVLDPSAFIEDIKSFFWIK